MTVGDHFCERNCMSVTLTIITATALMSLLIYSIVGVYRNKEWLRFALETVGISCFTLFLYVLFGFPIPVPTAAAKGAQDDVKLVTILFVFMILGMFAQAFYYHFSLPRSERVRKSFDWGLFLAPVCASPVVFIPLMVALQNADIDLKAMTVPRMMIFLVAFQNGFFWKEHFDRKRKDDKGGSR
jgi:hypothetical protein